MRRWRGQVHPPGPAPSGQRATKPCRTADSTACQTSSSVVVYVSTCSDSTPHDNASARTVARSGDRPISRAVGRNLAIARAVLPDRVQHRIASAPASVAAKPGSMRDGHRDAIGSLGKADALQPAEVIGPLGVVRVSLGPLGDARHRSHDVDRIHTDGRLGRQHQRVGAVEHRVGDIADLGARRRRAR